MPFIVPKFALMYGTGISFGPDRKKIVQTVRFERTTCTDGTRASENVRHGYFIRPDRKKIVQTVRFERATCTDGTRASENVQYGQFYSFRRHLRTALTPFLFFTFV